MFHPTNQQILFIATAFIIQVVLTAYFALRKNHFSFALRIGTSVYALGIPAAAISLLLLVGGSSWPFWLGGFLYLAWATFGYIVEYMYKIEWRLSRCWQILVPYICLYLATVMFYWFPLGLIYKPLWYAYLVLFALSAFLNITSHQPIKNAQ